MLTIFVYVLFSFERDRFSFPRCHFNNVSLRLNQTHQMDCSLNSPVSIWWRARRKHLWREANLGRWLAEPSICGAIKQPMSFVTASFGRPTGLRDEIRPPMAGVANCIRRDVPYFKLNLFVTSRTPLVLYITLPLCNHWRTLYWSEIRSYDAASSPSRPSTDTTPVHYSPQILLKQVLFMDGFYSVTLCHTHVDNYWINLQKRKDFAVTRRHGLSRWVLS